MLQYINYLMLFHHLSDTSHKLSDTTFYIRGDKIFFVQTARHTLSGSGSSSDKMGAEPNQTELQHPYYWLNIRLNTVKGCIPCRSVGRYYYVWIKTTILLFLGYNNECISVLKGLFYMQLQVTSTQGPLSYGHQRQNQLRDDRTYAPDPNHFSLLKIRLLPIQI